MSAVEIGKIVDGVVTGITSFGAFIQLPDGKTGLCHISEIADSYVKNVSDFLKESQPVKVKVINVDEKGKVSLSIRQATPKPEGAPVSTRPSSPASRPHGYPPRSSDSGGYRPSNRPSSPAPYFAPKSQNSRTDRRDSPGTFEDMLSGFMKDSDDKLKGIKKNAKSNRKGNSFNSKER